MALADSIEFTFDNTFTEQLPADPDTTRAPRQVHGAAYSRVDPTPVSAPQLLAFSAEVAADLGIADNGASLTALLPVLAGNTTLDGMDPHAMCYGGHQFGNWAGQLGDGRAIGLGEVINSAGERWAIQLKGAGRTPYSRTADGLAVLRSSVREFLCSEAMFHLGVPTTRALSLVTTGERVMRDMFYDGNPDWESGAVVCRVAPSFIRFGNFQLPASRGDNELLRQLADHTLTTHFAHLGDPSPAAYAAMFDEVCSTSALMVAHWMRVGFVHGVMNTDNMSILGLTIDYGPYGWLEGYDPDWTPNTTDASQRRYRFGQQPQVAHWNLVQLANALHPLIDDTEPLQASIDAFPDLYSEHYQSMMAAKLGLDRWIPEADEPLLTELIGILRSVETDMTIFFRELADVDIHRAGSGGALTAAHYRPEQIDSAYTLRLDRWLSAYSARVRSAGVGESTRASTMNEANPRFVLRNYLAQLAIDDAERGDFAKIHELLDTLKRPYTEQSGREHLAEKRPEWARQRAGCSQLSCSS